MDVAHTMLSTGAVVPTALVTTTRINLDLLRDIDPVALAGLTTACRDPSYQLAQESADILVELRLIEGVDDEGCVRHLPGVREIVVAPFRDNGSVVQLDRQPAMTKGRHIAAKPPVRDATSGDAY